MQRRKLQKSRKLNIKCGREGAEQLPIIHEFLAECRRSQGLIINIPLKTLQRQFIALPDRYYIFSAYFEHTLCAAAIINKVAEDTVYYYLPGTAPTYKKLSPMVSLLHYIYTYFLDTEIRTIDLGVTSVNGQRQEGLSKFKLRMGAEETIKNTWVYGFDNVITDS